MLNFFEDAPNIANEDAIRSDLEQYHQEVREFLPELPKELSIWLSNNHLITETGEGGFAYSPKIMNISFDETFEDKEKQLAYLKGTFFHEAYHLVQGHTYEDSNVLRETMLDNAIYEGCATVFEREYADVVPPWGDYSLLDESQLNSWRDSMLKISREKYRDVPGLWEKWAFYDDEDNQKWKVYKTGTWIADMAIRESGVDILEMRRMSAAEVLILAGVSI